MNWLCRFSAVPSLALLAAMFGGASFSVAVASSDGPVASSPAWTLTGQTFDDRYGYAVAVGNSHGPGLPDLIVGVYAYDDAFTDQGRAELFQHLAATPDSPPIWAVNGDRPFAQYGQTVASAGDVNHDGFEDILVAAPSFSNDEEAAGAAFLYLGSLSGIGTTPAWKIEGTQRIARLGNALATAGDVNGDGFDDVIVGTPYYDNPDNNGKVELYLGTPTGLAPTPAWTRFGDQKSCELGAAVACAGDVNNDGYDDVLIAAPDYENTEPFEGRVYLYLGSAAGLADIPAWKVDGGSEGAMLGASVASAGDVNNDGFDDVLLGAPTFTDIETYEGAAFLFLGNSSGLDAAPVWSVEGKQRAVLMGYHVTAAGDLNADGYDDVLISAPAYDTIWSDDGLVVAYLGSPTGVLSGPAWTTVGDHIGARLGVSILGGRDINADGYPDIVCGADYHRNRERLPGRIQVYLGGPSLAGDCNDDRLLTNLDFTALTDCLEGPGSPVAQDCICTDANADASVDLRDFASYQRAIATWD